MQYIIVLVLVIAIVIVAIRKQKFDQKQKKQQNNEFTNKNNDIYVNGYEEKDDTENKF